jgi:hypothetical protein
MKKIIILIVVVCTLSFFNQFAIGVDTDGGEISSGDTLTGLINPKIDADTFTFIASAGQNLIARICRESDSLTPAIYLYSPNGSKEAEAVASDYWREATATLMYHTIQNTGQYEMVVMDSGTNQIGNYSLSLLLNPGAISSITDSDGGNAIPDEVYSGEIDYISDIDAFTFSASAGQTAVIVITRESGGINPEMYLSSPNGSKEAEAVANDYFGEDTATLRDHTIENTGQYKMVIMDAGANHIGGYSFTITLIGSGTSEPSESTPDDIDGDKIPNTLDMDDDNDGYTDYIEDIMGTDPLNPNSKPIDSDNDGIPDLIDDDNDNDGYTDYEENKEHTDPLSKTSYPNIEQQDTDKDGLPDSTDDDDDNDKYTDVQEIIERTNPLDLYSFPKDVAKFDTDVDGIFDSEDTDDDNDGMPDHWELFYGFNPLNDDDANDDMDKDVYSNLQEFKAGSNPRDKDSYPNKGLSIIEITLMAVSLISGMISLGGVVYAFYRNPVWMYKRKIKKTTTINELDKLWKNDIQPAIDNKKIKPKHIRKIKECYNKQKSDLIQKQKVQDTNKKS